MTETTSPEIQAQAMAALEETTGLPVPNPALIAELFDTDPLKLSDQDLDVIIAELRKDRLTFLETSKGDAKKSKTKGAASSAKSAVVPLGQISLEDLGLL